DPRQAKGQPVLAAHRMAYALETLWLLLANESEQCRRGRDMRHLPGDLDRVVEDTVGQPSLNDCAGAAIQRQNGATKRLFLAIGKIDAVTMGSRRIRLDSIGAPAAMRDGLPDCIGRRVPQFVHVALDMMRFRHELRHATAGDSKL